MPLPEEGASWALFLDVDGTLLPIAATPEAARPQPALLPLLERLSRGCERALALVSGRSLASIDRLFAPFRPAAAGLHGWERRRSDGSLVPQNEPSGLLARLRPRLETYVRARPGLMLEDKGGSLALHYRQAPERGAALLRLVRRLARAEPELHVIAGRKVVEVQPLGADKGAAIRAFLAEPPFAGRRPVFAGDDTTDEHGFEAVNELGGLSVRVVDAETRMRSTSARYTLESVDELHCWLGEVAQRFDAPKGTAGFGSAVREHRPQRSACQ
ncbi:MAG TPA: trehalose-phosphatase [Stellaceae bacterium]|nr:trehalose-phosphatase [Stellaceae bacterium]